MNSQSDSRHELKLQTSNNKQQNRSSLLSPQNSVYTYHYKDKHIQNNKMDLKTVELIENKDASEKTLQSTTRWRETTKPGDYHFTQGQ